VVRNEGIRLEGMGQIGIFYVSNCWPNLRVHAPKNSGYHLLTSLKPSSLAFKARPNCKSGAACDPLQLANKLERHIVWHHTTPCDQSWDQSYLCHMAWHTAA
jgi:hypothetical protein